jgi:hypothetical protein
MTRFEISGTRRRKREGGWVFVLRDGQVLPRAATTATIMLPCRVFSFTYTRTRTLRADAPARRGVARQQHGEEEGKKKRRRKVGETRQGGGFDVGGSSACNSFLHPRTDGL